MGRETIGSGRVGLTYDITEDITTVHDNIRRLFGLSTVNISKIIYLDRYERLPPWTCQAASSPWCLPPDVTTFFALSSLRGWTREPQRLCSLFYGWLRQGDPAAGTWSAQLASDSCPCTSSSETIPWLAWPWVRLPCRAGDGLPHRGLAYSRSPDRRACTFWNPPGSLEFLSARGCLS